MLSILLYWNSSILYSRDLIIWSGQFAPSISTYNFVTAAISKAIASGTCKQQRQGLAALWKEYRTFCQSSILQKALAQERFEDGRFYTQYSIIPRAIPPTCGRNYSIQHDAIASEQFCIVKWIGGSQEATGGFGLFFFLLLLITSEKERASFQQQMNYPVCSWLFQLQVKI